MLEQFRTAVALIDAHPNAAAWVQGVGTVAAAAVALVAAVFAYKAAVRTALATVEVHRMKTAEERQVLASALWAELNDCRTRLAALIEEIRCGLVRAPSDLPVQILDLGIYKSNQSAIGRLPPDEALAVVTLYKVLALFDAEASAARSDRLSGMGMDVGEVRRRAKRCIEILDTVLKGLAQTAGHSDEILEVHRRAMTHRQSSPGA